MSIRCCKQSALLVANLLFSCTTNSYQILMSAGDQALQCGRRQHAYFIRQFTHEYGSFLVPQALILQPLQLKQRVRLGFLCAVKTDFLASFPTGVPSDSMSSVAASAVKAVRADFLACLATGVPLDSMASVAPRGVPSKGPTVAAAPAAATAAATPVTPAPVLAAAPALLALGPRGVRCNPFP